MRWKGREDDVHLANSRAAARPIPLAAPVMTATRPACMTGWCSLSIGEMRDSMRKGVVGGRNGEGPRSLLSPMGMMKNKKNKKRGNEKRGFCGRLGGMFEYISLS